jgi:phosphoglycolate phosphatase
VKLVLFDIDGTLLSSGGAGRRAIRRALMEVFGATGPEEHWFDGKTDPQIVRELMRIVGHPDDHIDRRMDALFRRYVAYLEAELGVARRAGARALPGVPALLDALERESGVALGLLTGNLVEGARVKLRAVGIDPSRFRVGAFGSDHERREELPAIAQRRAREVLGLELTGDSIYLVGDTPSDIHCGRGIGARAIGVATGRYPPDALAACGARAVFRDLAETAAVVSAILD